MSRDRFVMFSTGMLIALFLGMALSGAFTPAGSGTTDGFLSSYGSSHSVRGLGAP